MFVSCTCCIYMLLRKLRHYRSLGQLMDVAVVACACVLEQPTVDQQDEMTIINCWCS